MIDKIYKKEMDKTSAYIDPIITDEKKKEEKSWWSTFTERKDDSAVKDIMERLVSTNNKWNTSLPLFPMGINRSNQFDHFLRLCDLDKGNMRRIDGLTFSVFLSKNIQAVRNIDINNSETIIEKSPCILVEKLNAPYRDRYSIIHVKPMIDISIFINMEEKELNSKENEFNLIKLEMWDKDIYKTAIATSRGMVAVPLRNFYNNSFIRSYENGKWVKVTLSIKTERIIDYIMDDN